jgi:hypothetical protein
MLQLCSLLLHAFVTYVNICVGLSHVMRHLFNVLLQPMGICCIPIWEASSASPISNGMFQSASHHDPKFWLTSLSLAPSIASKKSKLWLTSEFLNVLTGLLPQDVRILYHMTRRSRRHTFTRKVVVNRCFYRQHTEEECHDDDRPK